MFTVIYSLGLFIIFLLLGAPVAFCLGLPIILYLILNQATPLAMIPHRMTGTLFTYVLIALPAFLLAGRMMNTSGVTNRLLDVAIALVGRFRGGLAYANALASCLFASMSGTSVGDAGGLGQVEMKMMKDAGYRLDFAAGITGASSALGPVIPPSVVMVILGATAEISVGRLFLSGVLPGIALLITLMISIWVRAHLTPEGRTWQVTRVTLKQAVRALARGILPLLTPVIIIGGIAFGVVTPTEAAILAIDYAVVLGLIYRQMTFRSLWQTLEETVVMTGVFMFIMAVAGFFTWVMTREGLPQLITGLMNPLITSGNSTIGLAMIAVFMLVIGLFLDATPAILLVTPTLLPVVNALGIDPTHFGMVMIMALVTGIITPPYGMCLFVMSDVAGISVARVTRESILYLPAMMVVLTLVVFFPWISTWLPELLLGVPR